MTSGAQPAVIELWEHGKPIKFDADLIVVPSKAPHEEVEDNPVYSACLKVMWMDYEAVINRANNNDEIDRWSAASWNVPPFTTFLQQQATEHLCSLIRTTCSAKLPNGGSLEDLILKIKESALWTPVHLSDRAKAKRSEDRWQILQKWSLWESRGFDWKRRYRDWDPDRGGKPAPEETVGIERMRKICSYMGLKKINSRVSAVDRIARKLKRALNRPKQ